MYALMEDVASISSNFPSIQSIKNFKSITEYFNFIQRGMLVLPDALPRKVLLNNLSVCVCYPKTKLFKKWIYKLDWKVD